MLVVGIDPATGSSSDTGYCVFNPDTKEILCSYKIGSKHRPLEHRIKDISDIVEGLLLELVGNEVLVCIESFVMRGKGGESLQRIIGSFMGRVPYEFTIAQVQNTSVKLLMAGHGHADKVSVAFGTKDFFAPNLVSQERIKELTAAKEFDILDAIAIGASGWLQAKKPKLKKT